MKRHGDLFKKIIHKQNILLAHKNARKGKSKYFDIKNFDNNLTNRINNIHDLLNTKKYKVSEYKIDTRIERGKERVIFKLPYNPDRVIHHALLQIIEPILSKTYIKDTYQSIKGRGAHRAKKRVNQFLKDKENTKYCLKIDIKKFYPSVDNNILKQLIRHKIKCIDTLELIDTIIDSTKGLPIGNYTSQTFGNYYLSFFDHYVKETLKIKYYVRYADDMVFFSNSKHDLHLLKNKIEFYLNTKLNLQLKNNWQVFPTRIRGLDFLGFRFFERFILLRKSIKKAYLKVIKKINNGEYNVKNLRSLMSYYGWLKSTSSYNLIRKTITITLIKLYGRICRKLGINNPLRNIVLVPKKQLNSYGNYQPNLLDFL